MLIDSNIIVEIGRQQKREKICSDFLNAIKEGMVSEDIFVTQFSLHAIEALLGNKNSSLVKEFLIMIYNGLIKVYNLKSEDDLMAISTKDDLQIDFDDTVQYIATNRLGTYLVTYDKDFSKTSLKTKTPEEVLKELAAAA